MRILRQSLIMLLLMSILPLCLTVHLMVVSGSDYSPKDNIDYADFNRLRPCDSRKSRRGF